MAVACLFVCWLGGSVTHVATVSPAYVHWYERHGCEASTIDEALLAVQDVVDVYEAYLPHDEQAAKVGMGAAPM